MRTRSRADDDDDDDGLGVVAAAADVGGGDAANVRITQPSGCTHWLSAKRFATFSASISHLGVCAFIAAGTVVGLQNAIMFWYVNKVRRVIMT
ncbi:unnamed protein product [Hydatigera taeniaeformis]|uniref:CASP-like protein n=1 Tax=Hydatigena taeniaeformis TaxID=6205 RepID=A0A0R3X8Q6_HYDTA|nr:unnamed protein product [Hydatigera taeniaeformis]